MGVFLRAIEGSVDVLPLRPIFLDDASVLCVPEKSTSPRERQSRIPVSDTHPARVARQEDRLSTR
jgi:hypothetical protein